MRKRIVVVGAGVAGFTAGLELKKRLGDAHDVTVVSRSDELVFTPSLIWVPFGLRTGTDILFSVRAPLQEHGVLFREELVTKLDLDNRRVVTEAGELDYDYLLLATGPRLNHAAIPGLGPRGYTHSIMTLSEAELAREGFERFLEDPGPVVIGAVQGASCFVAAYELLLNMAYQLKERGLEAKAPLTYLTPEPFVGHFGIGGFGSAPAMTERFFGKRGISAVTNAFVREITPDRIELFDGRSLRFGYAVLVPPFLGVDVVRACTDITDASGFVRVNERYRTDRHPEVFAAGAAVALEPRERTSVPWGVPKTGYLAEEMARVAAHNIAAEIHEEKLLSLPPASIEARCILDAGNTGLVMLSDHFLEPREHAWVIPGPEAHWAKVAFEKYFLATRERGLV